MMEKNPVYTNNEEVIREAILKAFPHFKDLPMSFNHRGWTSVIVDIDDTYICKFPRGQEKYDHLKNEHQLISMLKKNITGVEFPERTHIEADVPFFIHKKIKGEHFPLEAYQKADENQRQAFKKSVVDFLVQMHSVRVEDFKGCAPIKDEKLPPLAELEPVLENDFSGEASNKAKKILRDFNAAASAKKLVVGHYDMHGYNFVVDPKTKKIIGIFDFDEVAIGSAEFDLRELPLHYGPDVGKEIIEAYNKKAKCPVNMDRLETLHQGWSLFEYVRTKKRLDGDLKDVDQIDMEEYKKEIKQLLAKAKVGR